MLHFSETQKNKSITLRAYTFLAKCYEMGRMKDIDEIRRENLRALEKEAGGPSDAAKKVEMTPAQFTNLREGAKDSKTGKPRGMRKETARRIEAAFGKSAGWLDADHAVLSGEVKPAPPPESTEAPAPPVPNAAHGEFVMVKRADVSFSNGHGRVEYENDDHPPLVFRSDFLRKLGIAQGDAVVVQSVGISNEPTIPDGAVVLVNRGDKQRLNGDLFAFRVDGELLIKRLEMIDGVGILTTAENPNFKPKQKVYQNPPDFEVIGRATWVGAVL